MLLPASPPLSADTLQSPDLLELPGLIHGFTTRGLGTAAEPGHGGGPAAPDAMQAALGARGGTFALRRVKQVHGRAVALPRAPDGETADALLGTSPGELLVIRTADCLSILLASRNLGATAPTVVAAVHAGWRGLVAGIITATRSELENLQPGGQIVAALGPSIGPCCFEVGPEVAEAFSERGHERALLEGQGDRSYVDLPMAACAELSSLGIAVSDDPPPCTRCEPERFHSYRAEGASAGRMAAFIGLDVT